LVFEDHPNTYIHTHTHTHTHTHITHCPDVPQLVSVEVCTKP